MTDRELMQQVKSIARKLENKNETCSLGLRKKAAAMLIKLAQPEPEPFEYWNAVEGWVKIEEVRQHFDTAGCGTIYKTSGEGRVPLYTAPPQREWKGLTEEEIFTSWKHYADIVREVEAALKEKNEN